MVTRRQILQAGGALSLAAGAGPLLASRAAATSQQDIVINFWNWWGVAREPLMKQIIVSFERSHPHITIKDIVRPFANLNQQVVTALASGKPPQVIMATRQEIVAFAARGSIIPITPYVRAAGLNLKRFYPQELATMYWKGELYSMPMPTAGGETSLYFYNKDLFTRAGLNPQRPPLTWKELETATAKLTKRRANGKIDLLGADILGAAATGSFSASFISWLYTNGGTLYSNDLKTVAFNNARGVATLHWMIDFIKKYYGGVQHYADFFTNTTGESGQYPFYQNRQGIWFNNVSTFFHIKTLAPHLNYSVALRPYNSANAHAQSHGVAGLSFGWGYVIPKGFDPATNQAAFEWIRAITYDKPACQFMLAQERPSPLIDCNNNPAFARANPHWATVTEALRHDVALPIVPQQTRILDIIDRNVQSAFYGQVSAKQALDAAAMAAQPLLRMSNG
jgi:multiple sugar transport system substrate-binding protein